MAPGPDSGHFLETNQRQNPSSLERTDWLFLTTLHRLFSNDYQPETSLAGCNFGSYFEVCAVELRLVVIFFVPPPIRSLTP